MVLARTPQKITQDIPIKSISAHVFLGKFLQGLFEGLISRIAPGGERSFHNIPQKMYQTFFWDPSRILLKKSFKDCYTSSSLYSFMYYLENFCRNSPRSILEFIPRVFFGISPKFLPWNSQEISQGMSPEVSPGNLPYASSKDATLGDFFFTKILRFSKRFLVFS